MNSSGTLPIVNSLLLIKCWLHWQEYNASCVRGLLKLLNSVQEDQLCTKFTQYFCIGGFLKKLFLNTDLEFDKVYPCIINPTFWILPIWNRIKWKIKKNKTNFARTEENNSVNLCLAAGTPNSTLCYSLPFFLATEIKTF